MARRIIYILLAVVLILAIILGIRWWLNRGDSADAVVDETAVVTEGVGDTVTDLTAGETTSSGDTGAETTAPESSGTPVSSEVTTPPEGEVAPPTEGEGSEPAEGEGTTTTEGTGSTDSATTEESAGAQDSASGGDATTGGASDAGDPNVGGDATADSATESSAPGTGGVADTTPVFITVGQPVQHFVKSQEWLTQLARCYGTTVADIQAANNFSCPDLIQPGWVINISNPGNASAITINEMPCFTYYTVQQGENLYRIAERYGIHYQWLARINAIYNYDLVFAGQVLVIPNPVAPEFTTPPAQPYFFSSCWNCQ